MKLVQLLLTLFLLPGLPLFQIDQAVDFDWVVSENSLVIKSEMYSHLVNENVCSNPKPSSVFLNKLAILFQWKNPLSILLFYFQGASPFWRPPPLFHASIF